MSADPNFRDHTTVFAYVAYIPEPLAGFLNRLREELVPNCFLRAHVTILPPRRIAGNLDDAWQCLSSVSAGFEPFEIELGDIEVFPITQVIHIGVRYGADQLCRMHDALNTGSLYQREQFEYRPHITLAQNLKPDELDELLPVSIARWAEFPHSRRFRVTNLCFVQGTPGRTDWIDLKEYHLAPQPCLT